MICFHFTIFVVLETTLSNFTTWQLSLWFAFILLSLSYWKQRCRHHFRAKASCDLLSFYYLCRTGNNEELPALLLQGVVICFHFTIFVVLETTPSKGTGTPSSCDLLSFYYLCRTGNNGNTPPPVEGMLWFAFILLSLSYWKQPPRATPQAATSCDLLSFYYLCRTGNNFCLADICRVLLWFAFILLSLSYWKQPSGTKFTLPASCDLLSFYYLCRTGNNKKIYESCLP